MIPEPRRKLFLSYSSAQAEWASAFHGFLVEALPGLSSFLDQEQILPGDDIQERLEAGLREAHTVLLLASPEALSSQWVLEELKRARQKAEGGTNRIVSAAVVPVELPSFLTSAQVIRLGADARSLETNLRGLVARLARRLELPASPASAMPAAPEPRLAEGVRKPLQRLLARCLVGKPAREALCRRMEWEQDVLDSFADLGGPPLAAQAAWTRATRDEQVWLAREALLDALLRLVDAVIRCHDLGMFDSEAKAARDAIEAERERLRPPAPLSSSPSANGPTPVDLDALRARYLSALADEHSGLIPLAEGTGRGERVEHVYVELTLAERERAPGRGELDARQGHLGLRELLELERETSPGITGRWILRGDPGAGKTTLLRHFAWQCARGEVPERTPVFLSLARLFRSEGAPDLERASLELLPRAADEGLREAWRALLAEEQRRGRLLLMLDGLDEVPSARAEDALAWLRALARDWPKAALVVSTRKLGYRRPSPDFVEVDLQPLGRKQQVELLAHWLPSKEGAEDRDRAEALATELSRVQSLRELAGNPLHLTLFALLACERGAKPMQRRSQLFERILGLLLRGGHRPAPNPGTPFKSPHVRKALRHLAYGTTVDDLLETSKEDLVDRLEAPGEELFLAKLVKLGTWGEDLSHFLEERARETSILGPHVAGPDGPWRFLHKSFREALAAEQLARRVEREGLEPILEAARSIEGDEGRWAEPFALLAGSVRDPDALISALEEVRPSLARSALATAAEVGTATAERMLGLAGDIEERGKVILGLVDRMTYPQDGVRLIARMAAATRDGNDLYFYYEALREAERREECAILAREARRHFFDHVALPAERRIFERVDTCEGERELWRRVEAGVYVVGSPEGVGDDDERPRHEVELTRPFRIAIVPVTNDLLLHLYPEHSIGRGEGAEPQALARHPAVGVTWYEAQTFARWLAKVVDGDAHFERHGNWLGTLPTEAQWEVVCRAGNLGRWCFGDAVEDLPDYAWFGANSGGRTHPVALKRPNGWGLHDVHGNVWEWCLDGWRRHYGRERVSDPIHPDGPGDGRVARGGSFKFGAENCRSAYRSDWFFGFAGFRFGVLGFRVALPAEL